MMCSICGAELKDNGVCCECGFDTGLDYVCYPTVFPVSGGLSISARREEWKQKNRDYMLCPNCGGKFFSFRQRDRLLICSACGRWIPLEEAAPHTQFLAEDPSNWDFDVGSGTLYIQRQEAMRDYPERGAPWYAQREQLRMVIVEPGVTAIGERAFSYLSFLTRVVLPEGLQHIRAEAFGYCMRLERLELPASVESIGDRAFQYCERLRELNRPAGLKSLGKELLRGCVYLQDSLFADREEREEQPAPEKENPGAAGAGMQEDAENWEFDAGSGTLFIHRQEAMQDYPERGAPWFAQRKQIRVVIVESGVTGIGERAFAYLSFMTRIVLPDSLRQIGAQAFEYCVRLEKLIIPEGVETVGDGAFQYCERLRELTLPSGLASVGNSMLCGCGDLRDLFFRGNREQWTKLVLGKELDINSRAELHCAE